MKDQMIMGTLRDYPVRFYIAVTTEAVQTMNAIHETTPVAAAAAGRVLTAAGLMGAMMKNKEDLLTLTVKGDGEIGRITAVANNAAEVKCEILHSRTGVYFNEKRKLDVARVVGNGTLSVIRDIGLKQSYVGQVELISGEIAEDVAYYFAKSEQTPSMVALGVFVRKDLRVVAAGGYIIQLMPDCDEEMISFLESKAAALPSVTSMILDGYDAEGIAKMVFGEYEYELLGQIEPVYHCSCSEERIDKMLLALGEEELTAILEEGEEIEVVCHFCNTKYLVGIPRIRALLESGRNREDAEQ
ncbi:MAG: Hsp33 family molecular chaperone HslO [Anaerofustis sp.]